MAAKLPFILLLLATAFCVRLVAQSNPEMVELKRQIALTDELLRETADRQQKTVTQLNLLGKQISLRKQLIHQLSLEISLREDEIEHLNELICSMEEDLEEILFLYTQTVRAAYKNLPGDDFWLALFSSANPSEAYYRFMYFRQFTRYRRQQMELIQRSRAFLEEKAERLTDELEQRQHLLGQKAREMRRLQSTKTRRQELAGDLESKAREYSRRLKKQQVALKSLLEQIERNARLEEDAASPFGRLKGTLSWPVSKENSLLLSPFGDALDEYGNPITNDGLFIVTAKGEPVRAIYSGEVTAVQSVPMSGQMVVIVHGAYRSVYANLSAVMVKAGDLIAAGHQIGVVKTDNRTGETVLNFMIYKSTGEFLDPQAWMTGHYLQLPPAEVEADTVMEEK